MWPTKSTFLTFTSHCSAGRPAAAGGEWGTVDTGNSTVAGGQGDKEKEEMDAVV